MGDRNDPRFDAGQAATGSRFSIFDMLSLVADKGPAGRMLRRVLPVALVLIGLSGGAVLAGHRFGHIDSAAGGALFALANGSILVAAIFWSAWLLQGEYATRRRIQEHIAHYALHDPLTGLANRSFFLDQLARRAALADRRTSMPFAVCCMELDGFERVKQQLGHAASDRILIKVADVTRESLRASDLVARLDGDRFGMLFEELVDAKDAAILAQRIISSVSEALTGMADAPIGVGIGIVLKTSGHDLPGEILQEADAALVTAKKRGLGRFELTVSAG
jgi:diguanylate cyclase (GGDEF)-like protein